MKRFLVLSVTLFSAAVAPAAEPAKPAIEFRMKSVVDLLPLVEYGGELAGQANTAEQVAAIIKMFADQKQGLEGVDLTKPVGGYVIVAENVADSPIVLMVPVASEEAFLGLLTDRANLNPKKEDDGTYSMEVPDFPASVHLRFANGYAYLGVRSAAGIAKDKLLSPKDFFAGKSDAVFAASVYPDRIPADLRSAAFGQLELQLNDGITATDPTQKAVQTFLADRATDMLKTVLTDGAKLSLALTADPKADDIAVELVLTPKTGTPLAKTLGGWADRPSAAAGVATAVTDSAFAVAVNFGLPSETKAGLNKLIDTAVENLIANANGNDKATAKLVFDALLPTAKTGELELGVVGVGPDSKGKFGGVAALRTASGNEVVKIAKALSLAVPASAATLKFDIGKVGDGQLHAISGPALANPKLVAESVQLYTSDPLFAVTLAEDADGLKKMLATKPAKTPMLLAQASVVKMFRLFKEIDADDLTRMTDEAFAKPVRAGDDVIRLTGTGGAELRLKLTAKGRALAFLRVVSQ